jgi:hypothetical protein
MRMLRNLVFAMRSKGDEGQEEVMVLALQALDIALREEL